MMENAQTGALGVCSVNTGKEPGQAMEMLRKAVTGALHRFVLVLFGPRAIGKTALVDGLWTKNERVMPCGRAYLHDYPWERPESLASLLAKLIGEIADRLPPVLVDLPADYETSSDKGMLAEHLVRLVASASKYEKPTLLLLDDYDCLSPEARTWLEAKVLIPLGRTRRCVVVLTSEFDLRFSSFELRMRYESYRMPGTRDEAIACAYPEYANLAPAIYKASGGLPSMVERLVVRLKEQGAGEESTIAALVLERYYAEDVAPAMGRYVPSELRATLYPLALLRRFDFRVLKEFLPRILPDTFADYTAGQYLELTEQLGSWIEPQSQGGYAVHEAYRQILRGYIQRQDASLYARVQQAAFDFYHSALESEYRRHYMVELFYHRLALLMVRHGINDISQARAAITPQEFVKEANGGVMTGVKEDDLLDLFDALANDGDLALCFSREDIRKILDVMVPAPLRIPLAEFTRLRQPSTAR